MNSILLRKVVVAGALALIGVPAWAQSSGGADKQAVKDPVVARVNGTEIRRSDVEITRRALPRKYQSSPLKNIFPRLLPGLVNATLAAEAARAKGLDKSDAVRRRLAGEERRILAGAYFQYVAAERVTEKALREQYKSYAATEGGKEEVRARHILLKTEDGAKAVIEELEGGADFVGLAKKKSTGPSAAKGGDLGFFERKRMVKSFADAAFALKEGKFTPKPVKTQFGWHVIKLEQRRTSPVPSFQKSRSRLTAQLHRKIASELMADLKRKAKIEMFNLDGSPRASSGGKAPASK